VRNVVGSRLASLVPIGEIPNLTPFASLQRVQVSYTSGAIMGP
jgi:hypothetical protein